MLFSYGVHTSEKGKNLKCFLLRCNLFVSVSFLPPVILVMIYEALYIKVLKHSSRLRLYDQSSRGVFPQNPTRGQHRSALACCISYKQQQRALLYRRFRKGDRRERKDVFFIPLTSQNDFIIPAVAIIPV